MKNMRNFAGVSDEIDFARSQLEVEKYFKRQISSARDAVKRAFDDQQRNDISQQRLPRLEICDD